MGRRPTNFWPNRSIELEQIWLERKFKVIRAERGQSGASNQFLKLTSRLPGAKANNGITRNPLKTLVGAQGLEPWTR